MARIFILDDMQVRHDTIRQNLFGHDIVSAMNYTEACKIVYDSDKFDIFFLDHDLEDAHYSSSGYSSSQPYERTGYSFVQWMITTMPKSLKPDLVIVHSWNDAGAKLMAEALREAGFKVHVEEFSSNLGQNLKIQQPSVISRKVISKPGAGLVVEELELSDEAKEGLATDVKKLGPIKE